MTKQGVASAGGGEGGSDQPCGLAMWKNVQHYCTSCLVFPQQPLPPALDKQQQQDRHRKRKGERVQQAVWQAAAATAINNALG